MDKRTLEILETVARANMKAELDNDSYDGEEKCHKRAMDAVNKYIELKKLENEDLRAKREEEEHELRVKEHELNVKNSRWSHILGCITLFFTTFVGPILTMAINERHLNTVCQLENIDSVTSTGGKSLLRGMFNFR